MRTGRVIALCDLDAFYAQVEQKVRGIPWEVPCAVQQYSGLIAVNYAAKACGVRRFTSISDAQLMCPGLQLLHVTMRHNKVDLTKYRLASTEIFKALRQFTPLLEHASIDEAFLDLTTVVDAYLDKIGGLGGTSSQPGGGDGGGGGEDDEDTYGGGVADDSTLMVAATPSATEQIGPDVDPDSGMMDHETQDHYEHDDLVSAALMNQLESAAEGDEVEKQLLKSVADEEGQQLAAKSRASIAGTEAGEALINATREAGQNDSVVAPTMIPSKPVTTKEALENVLDAMEQLLGLKAREGVVSWQGILLGEDGSDIQGNPPRPEGIDEVRLAVGSMMAAGVRAWIKHHLGYSMSGGVAHNKMLAKLIAGKHKPYGQTVLRDCDVSGTMNNTPLSDIRFFGGKLGRVLRRDLGFTTAGDVARADPAVIRTKFGSSTSLWISRLVKGIDTDTVKLYEGAKSMAAMKNFRRLESHEQCLNPLQNLADDLSKRVLAEKETNGRRPKSLTLTVVPTHGGSRGINWINKSRTVPMPPSFTSQAIWSAACSALKTFHDQFPLRFLGLTATRFVGGDWAGWKPDGGASSAAMQAWLKPSGSAAPKPSTTPVARPSSLSPNLTSTSTSTASTSSNSNLIDNKSTTQVSSFASQPASTAPPSRPAATGPMIKCPRCGVSIAESRQVEHADEHFAMDLHAQQLSGTSSIASSGSSGSSSATGSSASKKRPASNSHNTLFSLMGLKAPPKPPKRPRLKPKSKR